MTSRNSDTGTFSMLSLQTRKPVGLLTTADFAAFPIWEFADDEEGVEGRDETWVRPLSASAIPRRAYVLAAAKFTTANGQRYGGFVNVSTLEEQMEATQGVILHRGEFYPIPHPEMFRFAEARAELLAGLGLGEEECFPLAFGLAVLLDGEQVARAATFV